MASKPVKRIAIDGGYDRARGSVLTPVSKETNRASYHVNPETGEAGICRAQSGNCPFASDEHHYGSIDDARAGYERGMQTITNREVAIVFIKNVNRRARKSLDKTIMNTLISIPTERPLDFSEWEGNTVSGETVMNMGLRIMADQIIEARSGGSETPYADALDRLSELTQEGELNFSQALGINLDHAHEHMTHLIETQARR